MSCKFNAPNGSLSNLFDKVYNGWGKPNAVKVWSAVQSKEFKDWYAKGATDVNGEPVLTELNEFVNEAGESLHIADVTQESLDPISLEDYSSQIEELTKMFEDQGLDITVTLDSDSDSIGSVITIDGKTEVKFNPRKIKTDSVFHEFGHILIDMLGVDHPVVQRGIEHLKGTPLWNQIEQLYPELKGERLAKEILTTAVGMEAATYHQEKIRLRELRNGSVLQNIKGWKTWAKHFFNIIADKLGIGQTAAQKLAYQLTGKNLRYALTHKPASYVQKQKVKPSVDKLKAESERLTITDDEQGYMIDKDPDRVMNRVTTAIDDLRGEFQRDEAIKRSIKSKKGIYADLHTKDDIGRNWADKREEGTALHLINELYIKQRNEGKSREEAIKYVMANLHKPKPGFDKEGIRFYSGAQKKYVETYIDDIADFLDSLMDKGYKLHPEVKVFDEELGVAGTIDLLIEKPDGTYMIYDFKTKEDGKFDSFYTIDKYENFQGIASGLARTKANEYALQLSTYKLILERKGFKVTDMAIIPFEGQMVEENGEFHYINVRLFSDTNTVNNKDGVLPVKDLSDVMLEFYTIKDDSEQILENAMEGEQTLDELLDSASELGKTKVWIEELVVNIKKSIARYRATATVTDATKYENEIKKLVDKLMVEDEMGAITAYTEYITRGLAGLHNKFFDKFPLVKDSQGKEYRTHEKGYDSYTWQDIKNLELTDPAAYMEFLAFLINADAFLNQVVAIEKLSYTDARTTNLVLRTLKSNEGHVSNLRNKIKRLNRELDKRYVELSSNPLYGGRGVLENTELFFRAQADETFMQHHTDALADTHNSYMANVMRYYDYKMRYMNDEILKVTNEWEAKIKAFEDDGGDISRFIDPDTARIIPKTDYERYYQARSDMFKRVDKTFNGVRDWKWRNSVNAWFKANTIKLTPEQTTALNKKMKAELGAEGFKEWKAQQTYADGKKTKFTSAYYLPNPKIYANNTYKTYNAKEQEFYDFLTSTLAYLTEHTKSSIVKEGYIPAIPKDTSSVLDQLKHKAGWRDSNGYNPESGVITNELNEIVQFVPFNYNNLLAKGNYIKVAPDATPAEKRDAAQKNAIEKQRVIAAHAASTNQDLKATMPIYIREALKNKYKKSMEFEVQRVRKSFIDNHKVTFTKGGETVKDKVKVQLGLENNLVEKATIDSKILSHYEKWLKMVFYEDFENDEGTLQKVARVMQNYTSYKGMAFNFLSAMNNQTYATLMSNIESAAGTHFSGEDWRAASLEYIKGTKSFLYDEDNAPTTKQSAFIANFNILMDFKEAALGNEEVTMANRALQKASWLLSKGYALEHISEHNLQNRVLFAMAMSHRIVDGKAMTFDEFKRNKLSKITLKLRNKDGMSKVEVVDTIAKNKEKEKGLREEFNKYQSLYESTTFENGKLNFSDNLTVEEIAEFERKVLGVNQYLHGIYNKDDAGTMQAYAIGRLAVQFRKWMRPGWNKRFGNRFGEKYWNERRSGVEEGIYVTTARFFATPIIDNWSEYVDKQGTDQAIGLAKFMTNLIGDYGRFLVNIRVHWHTMNDGEKANVVRTLLEYAAFCTAIGLLYVAKELKGDDDDPPAALMLTIYQLDRLATELTTYVPLAIAPGFVGGGWLNESKKLLKAPTATFSTMEALIKTGKHLISYPFATEEEATYQSGVYAGESKLQVNAEKLVPIWNQLERLAYLPQNYKYYKLF